MTCYCCAACASSSFFADQSLSVTTYPVHRYLCPSSLSSPGRLRTARSLFLAVHCHTFRWSRGRLTRFRQIAIGRQRGASSIRSRNGSHALPPSWPGGQRHLPEPAAHSSAMACLRVPLARKLGCPSRLGGPTCRATRFTVEYRATQNLGSLGRIDGCPSFVRRTGGNLRQVFRLGEQGTDSAESLNVAESTHRTAYAGGLSPYTVARGSRAASSSSSRYSHDSRPDYENLVEQRVRRGTAAEAVAGASHREPVAAAVARWSQSEVRLPVAKRQVGGC